MAITLTHGMSMAEATQKLNNALDKSDTEEQVINGAVIAEDIDGNPIPVSKDSQLLTKRDCQELDAKRYIILNVGETVEKSFLPFSTVIDNYGDNNLTDYPTRIYIPKNAKKIRFGINYYVPTSGCSVTLSLIKNGDVTNSEELLKHHGSSYNATGSKTFITHVIDVQDINTGEYASPYVQIYVDYLSVQITVYRISVDSISMEVLEKGLSQ